MSSFHYEKQRRHLHDLRNRAGAWHAGGTFSRPSGCQGPVSSARGRTGGLPLPDEQHRHRPIHRGASRSGHLGVSPTGGEVWLVDFGEPVGREQSRHGPVPAVSANPLNEGPAGVVIVAPITTAHRRIVSRIEIEPGTWHLGPRPGLQRQVRGRQVARRPAARREARYCTTEHPLLSPPRPAAPARRVRPLDVGLHRSDLRAGPEESHVSA